MRHIPNMLTRFRYAIAVALPIFFLLDWKLAIACATTIGGLTDLDGKIAHKFGWTSAWGAHHDLRADKWFCWSVTGVLWLLFGAHWYVVALTALQAIYDAISLYLKRNNIVGKVSGAAKWKTAFLMASLAAAVWSPVMPHEHTDTAFEIGIGLFAGAVVFGLVAGRGYVLCLFAPRAVMS